MLLDLVPIKMTSSHAIINLRGNRNHDTVKQNRILAKHPRHVIEIHKHYEMLASHAISVSNARVHSVATPMAQTSVYSRYSLHHEFREKCYSNLESDQAYFDRA